MDLRASLRDMRKKRRTDVGAINVVIKKKEEENSGRLEYRCKRKANHVGPSIIIAITPTAPLVSLLSVARESSLIFTHGSSHPTTHICIPPLSLALAEEPPAKYDSELLLGHGHLSTKELHNTIEKRKTSMPKTIKKSQCVLLSH